MQKIVRVNLAYLRLIRGKLSQRAISEATGIGQKTLSALETGASKGIDFSTLAKLCTFLKCMPSDLLLIEDQIDQAEPSAKALEKADQLIAQGLKAAMEAPQVSAQQLWNQFDAACERVRASAERAEYQQSKRKTRA